MTINILVSKIEILGQQWMPYTNPCESLFIQKFSRKRWDGILTLQADRLQTENS